MNKILLNEVITNAKRYYDVNCEEINDIWKVQLYQKGTNIIMFSFSDEDLNMVIESLSIYLNDVTIKN